MEVLFIGREWAIVWLQYDNNMDDSSKFGETSTGIVITYKIFQLSILGQKRTATQKTFKKTARLSKAQQLYDVAIQDDEYVKTKVRVALLRPVSSCS